MDGHYSHAHDAVAMVDRVPLVLLITCSITFGLFPGHFYKVIRAGTDPLVSRITRVTPLVGNAHNGSQSSVLSRLVNGWERKVCTDKTDY